MPYACAFAAIVSDAVCCCTGSEIAHWLFSHTNTTGSFLTEAKFIDSWKTPSSVAPSPKKLTASSPPPFICAANAAPTAMGIVALTIGTDPQK